ncbi:MAG TPA: TlyA family RNA methyltransferase [Deltaproteobacteria bacterium]|nr:TlyA family RNA methyltransferase [Deltaproteobacteria bacterium]
MKIRLDKILVDRGYVDTRSKALGMIMSGSVLVDGKPVTKAGTAINADADIVLKELPPYVSRAGGKLAAALDAFDIDLTGMVAVDIGASTGGFTDVMLQRGAARVYAVDVGHGQLHWRLRNDERVIALEGINARNLDPDSIPELCDIATFDVSFISLKLVVPPVLKVLKPNSSIIALIKPQFEAGRQHVKKGGIIRDEHVADEVIDDMVTFFTSLGLEVCGTIPSPVKGVKGNQEYLLYALFKGDA